jgi:D-alanine-D-alanine ligase
MKEENTVGLETRVAVLMGGPSAEREVSIKSGKAVARAFRQAGLSVAEVMVEGEDFLLPEEVDVAFLALHGTFGEDGGVQRLLDCRRIAYNGSDAESSERAFDKLAAKEAFVRAMVPTPEWFDIVDSSVKLHLFGLPVVVKPACQGSTIGVTLVRRGEDFRGACELALEHDQRALVERWIEGRELTVGILGDRALPVIEIHPEGEIFDYRSKYTKGVTRYEVPAPLTETERMLVQQVALRAFRSLKCRDYGRVDVMLGKDGIPYVLEVNTLPGLTETSLMPMAAAQEGMSFNELCLQLLAMALNRSRLQAQRANVAANRAAVNAGRKAVV